MKKIDWLYIAIGLLTLFALAAVPNTQFKSDIWFYYPAFFLVTYLAILHKKRPPLRVTLLVLAGFLIPDVIVRFWEGFRDSYISIPRTIFQIWGCVSAYIVYCSTKAIKATIIVLSFFMIGLYIHYLQPYWFNYSDYGNFTGKVEVKQDKKWSLYNVNGDTMTQNNYSGKVVVFDFWTTSCGVCFKKFPILESLYLKYKSNPKVIIQAINIPIERDTVNMAFDIIQSRKYSFPVMVGLNNMDSVFNVEVYPTTIVMQNNNIIYKGTIDNAENAIIRFLENTD